MKKIHKGLDDYDKPSSSNFVPHYIEKPSDIEKLKDHARRHWMLAHTSSLQYVLGRFATCTASGALCLLSALIFLQAAVRSLSTRSMHFCQGESDYTWSMTLVLISQAIAIGVGTIAPVIRWFNATRFKSSKGEFKVEKYWVQRLEEWEENPSASLVRNRRIRKTVHISKNKILGVLIRVQYAVVLVSKLIRLASILPGSWLSRLSSSTERREGVELSQFVLHLDEEIVLVQLIMADGCDDVDHWIHRGISKQPNHLVQILTKHKKFQGFNSNEVALLLSSFGHSCFYWALPVVTLTSIVITIAPPGVDNGTIQRGVDESLKRVRLIEDDERIHYGGHHCIFRNMRKAADIVWQGVDIYDRWLGHNLKQLAGKEKTVANILEKLADIGEKYSSQFDKKAIYDTPFEALAPQLMTSFCRIILQKRLGTDNDIFDWLQETIAGILCGCISHLPPVISKKLRSSSIDLREESIREAAYLLGEAEEILKKKEMMEMDPNSYTLGLLPSQVLKNL